MLGKRNQTAKASHQIIRSKSTCRVNPDLQISGDLAWGGRVQARCRASPRRFRSPSSLTLPRPSFRKGKGNLDVFLGLPGSWSVDTGSAPLTGQRPCSERAEHAGGGVGRQPGLLQRRRGTSALQGRPETAVTAMEEGGAEGLHGGAPMAGQNPPKPRRAHPAVPETQTRSPTQPHV